MRLNSHQLKSISEFSNMIAVAWFTGGVITPLLLDYTQLRAIFGISMFETLLFLVVSLYLIRDI